MMVSNKVISQIHMPSDITGLIPGVKGQRAFPTIEFKNSDPFLMLDHIGPEVVGTNWKLDGEGHDHPHRGFETITFMFEGQMDHRDSLGNKETLYSGSAQRMNAGSGIIHGGDMAADPVSGRFHEMQLWINNPMEEKMSTPDIGNYQKEKFPTQTQNGITLKVISGTLNQMTGPIKTKASTQIAHVTSTTTGLLTIGEFLPNYRVLVYVLEGKIAVAGSSLAEYQLAELSPEGHAITIRMEENSHCLVLAGQPLKEPVAFGGPFVMNTQEEVHQANSDFQEGKFGSIN